MFELGDKVKFSKFVKRTGNTGIDPDIEHLTEEQEEKLTNDDIQIKFRDSYDCKETVGIIVGKRTRVFETRFFIHEEYHQLDGDFYENAFVGRENEYKPVYLVACDLRGFKMVEPEYLELEGQEIK